MDARKEDLMQRLFVSPLFVKERAEAEAVSYRSFKDRKSTISEMWGLQDVMSYAGTNSSPFKISESGDIEIDIGAGKQLVDFLANSILTADQKADFQKEVGTESNYVDTYANAAFAISDVINPALNTMQPTERKKITEAIQATDDIQLLSTRQEAAVPGTIGEDLECEDILNLLHRVKLPMW